MATKFTPAPGLNVTVARNIVEPHIRRSAPSGSIWITAHDERVRKTHVEAEGQLIPANLRFVLNHPETTAKELARAPRDPDLSVGNRVNCRCVAAEIPMAVAEGVRNEGVVIEGTRIVGTASVTFNRVVESENPGQGDSGGGWVRAAVTEVVGKLSVRH
jgi:hypothetical protein